MEDKRGLQRYKQMNSAKSVLNVFLNVFNLRTEKFINCKLEFM